MKFSFLMIIILILGFNCWVVGIEITTEEAFSVNRMVHPKGPTQKNTKVQASISSSLFETGNRYPIELWYQNSGRYGATEEAVALLLQDQLEATGFFDVEVKSTDWAQYKSQFTSMPTFLLGWLYDYPDESNYIDPFVGSGAFSLGTNYSSSVMDSYIQTMIESSDRTIRQTAIKNALQLMTEDVPVVPLFTLADEFIVSGSDTSGITLEPSGRLDFAQISKAGSTEIILGTTASISTMDPSNVYSTFSSETLTQISHGLFELPSDGMEAEPVLVDSYSISGDGLTYTFNMKSGIKFTDGTSVTADDAIWSLNRSASLPGAPSFLLSGIDTTSFTALNSTAFSLQLTAKDGTFLQRLTYTNTWIFKEDPAVTDTLQGAGYIPIGIGPYEIIDWTPDVRMVLNTSNYYTPSTIGKMAPVTENITIQFFPSSTDLKSAIEGGDIDVAYRSFTLDEIKDLEANPSLQTNSVASVGIRYLIVNVQAHPNKNIRQAISLAIDRERFTNLIFEDKTQALYSMVPPGFETACNKGDPCAFPDQDLSMVKTLMESEGYSDGVIPHDPIVVTSNTEFLSQNFTGLGTIEVPYRFEGNNITYSGGNLIEIKDTTAYFTISNNLLNGMATSGNGIYFSNVTHGAIDNNHVYNNEEAGIQLYSSENNTISRNIAYNNNWDGIRLHTSNHYNTISHNVAYNNSWQGIRLENYNNNCTIHNNTVFDNAEDGIRLINSNNNTISNNTAYDGRSNGIHLLENSNTNRIFYNSLYINDYDGLAVRSHSNLIFNNSICDNIGNGIALGGNYNKLSNNLIYNNTHGIIPAQSNFSIFSYNTVFRNRENGIILTVSSNNNTILHNTVYNNADGISLWEKSDNNTISENAVHSNNGNGISIGINGGSRNNLISHNSAYYNYWNGITLTYCENSIIKRNSVYSNLQIGIGVDHSSNNLITANSIYDNSPRGIDLENSDYNIITQNILFNHVEWGISFGLSADNNIIQFNDFSGNTGGNPPQALNQGFNNTFSNNYWSDWSGVGVYSISDVGEDETPLMNPYHLSAPVITFPTSSTPTLKDSITIQWAASTDQFGHSITYSVFYSTDNGKSWKKLASDLTTTKFTWDLTTIKDGTIILLKAQATDSIGFKSSSLSPNTFTIKNPSMVPTTTPTTTTSVISTSTITSEEAKPSITPSWNVLVLLLSLLGMVMLRWGKKSV
ncbi:MAG: ABC transporter substrate-binding protein [Promethearchaeota archaeon]